MKYVAGILIAAVVAALVLAVAMTRDRGAASPDAETVSLPCMLDFWMQDCAPCRRMLPVVRAVKRQHAGALRVECIDIVQHPAIARQLRVKAVPTLIFFDVAGKEVHRHHGPLTQEEMSAVLKRLKLTAGGTRAAAEDHSLESLVALLSIAPAGKREGEASEKTAAVACGVTAYYLHASMRSGCSYDLEQTARDTLEQTLKPALRGANLVWNARDIDEPANAHLVKTFNLKRENYDLSRGIVVLVEMTDGKPKRWKIIGDLVSHRTDLEELAKYVRENATGFPAPAERP